MSALGSGWSAAHDKLKATEASLAVALDALRKIRLGHPCDVPWVIASGTLEKIENQTDTPRRQAFGHMVELDEELGL